MSHSSLYIRVHLIRFAHPCGVAFGNLSLFVRLWLQLHCSGSGADHPLAPEPKLPGRDLIAFFEQLIKMPEVLETAVQADVQDRPIRDL